MIRSQLTVTSRDATDATQALPALALADRRAALLESFRDLLDRLDVDAIEAEEAADRSRAASEAC